MGKDCKAPLFSFHLLPMWPSPSLDLESFSCLYQSFSHSSFAVKEILYQNVRICMTFRFFPTSKKRKGMNSIRNQWGCKAFQQTNRLLSLFILLTDVRSNSVGKKHFNPHNFREHFLTYMKTKWGNFLATVFEFVDVHSV